MDYLEFAGALIAITSAVMGGIWLVARNEVRDGVRGFIGIPEISAKVERVADLAESNAEIIRAIRPVHVAEYDALRSRIFSPCVAGMPCEFTIRARRTDFGSACDAPEVIGRVVVDRAGLNYTVDSAISRKPSRINGEWRSISSAFVTPVSAPPGVAEFYLVLGYQCPSGAVEQESVRMVFEILEATP